jgi:hypothetical protein
MQVESLQASGGYADTCELSKEQAKTTLTFSSTVIGCSGQCFRRAGFDPIGKDQPATFPQWKSD